MLTLIVGEPGGGKGYWSTKEAMRLMRNGHTVLGNLPLKWEGVVKHNLDRYGAEINPDQWKPLTAEQLLSLGKPGGVPIPEGTLECPTTIFWDEAHFELNARDHASNFKMWRGLFELVTVHRHYHCDLYFISQHEHNIDAQLPRVAHRILKFHKMKDLPIGMGIKWPVDQFRMNYFRPFATKPLDGEFVANEPWVWECYDSHNKLKEWDSLKVEKFQVKTGVAPRKKRMYKLAVVAIVFLFGGWLLYGQLSGVLNKVKGVDRPLKDHNSEAAKVGAPSLPLHEELRPPVPGAVVFGDPPSVWVDGFKIYLGERWREWKFSGLWEKGVVWTHVPTGKELKVRV